MASDLNEARAFVAAIDLRGTRRNLMPMAAADDAGAVFDKSKDQAQVIGSALMSFAQGVDGQVREAISDSALLAQLHANHQVDFQADPKAWFNAYSTVLQNVGWVLQDWAWSDYTADGKQAEVNQKILNLLTVALGAAPTAVAVVTAAIEALHGMTPNSPWITLFSRETQVAHMARVQVGLVTADANGDVFVSLVACILNANNDVTQVLFFRWKDAHASFAAGSQKVSINRASLTELGPAIRAKVRAYQFDYLSSIKDL